MRFSFNNFFFVLFPQVLSLSGVSTHSVVEAGELGIIEATLIFNEAVYGLSADKLSIIGGSILNMRSESNGFNLLFFPTSKSM